MAGQVRQRNGSGIAALVLAVCGLPTGFAEAVTTFWLVYLWFITTHY